MESFKNTNIISAIGNTPIIRLQNIAKHIDSEIYVKLEMLNPGGSTKDRMGVFMIEQAIKNGDLKPGGTIVECTSGNTGIGILLYANMHGYKCVFVMADKQSQEKIDALRAYGAKVIVCPTNVEPADPQSYYSVAASLAKLPNSYFVNQYDNEFNRQCHYEQTGPEIFNQTKGEFDTFVAPVGTGGTISGVGKYLKEKMDKVNIIGVDCQGSILKEFHETGKMGEAHSYALEGIGEDFIPENVQMDVIDKFLMVEDEESFHFTRKLLKEECIFTGGSAGAAVMAAIRYAEKLDKPERILILLHDHGSKYAGKIFNDQWMIEKGYTLEVSTDELDKNILEIIGNNGKLV
jgi:cystathionine beta-synthase